MSSAVAFIKFNKATGVTGELVRLEGSRYPEGSAHEIGDRYGMPIYNFLREMQTWNRTKILIEKRRKLKEFARLERAVKKKRNKSYYRRAKGCPGCS